MKKILIGILIVAALAGGVAGAYGVSRLVINARAGAAAQGITAPSRIRDGAPGILGRVGRSRMPGIMGDFNRGQDDEGNRTGMRGGRMGDWNRTAADGERISIDDAAARAQEYATTAGDDLVVTEVMEFQNNFYAVVSESGTGHPAFELLVNPYTGNVHPERGPNMMWNSKYGHMGSGEAVENTITMEQARAYAQQTLDDSLPGATVAETGLAFYGYYSFDYSLNDQVAGMLSVNGSDGQVWLHNWHGAFIAEKEITK